MGWDAGRHPIRRRTATPAATPWATSRARWAGSTLPNLERLGLGRCAPIRGLAPVPAPLAAHGIAEPVSPGKDSTTGHWELCGLVLPKPFATYPHGFPGGAARRVLPPHRARRAGQQGGVGHRDPRRTRGSSIVRTGELDRVYLGRQRLPGGGARGDGAAARTVSRMRRSRGRLLDRRARGVARHRAAIRGNAGPLDAHPEPEGPEPRAARARRCSTGWRQRSVPVVGRGQGG